MRKIVCPHCGYEFDDIDFENHEDDLWAICPKEEYADCKCPSCNKDFYVNGSYSPEYRSYKTNDDRMIEINEVTSDDD